MPAKKAKNRQTEVIPKRPIPPRLRKTFSIIKTSFNRGHRRSWRSGGRGHLDVGAQSLEIRNQRHDFPVGVRVDQADLEVLDYFERLLIEILLRLAVFVACRVRHADLA